MNFNFTGLVISPLSRSPKQVNLTAPGDNEVRGINACHQLPSGARTLTLGQSISRPSWKGINLDPGEAFTPDRRNQNGVIAVG
jgi:hypothetical protein